MADTLADTDTLIERIRERCGDDADTERLVALGNAVYRRATVESRDALTVDQAVAQLRGALRRMDRRDPGSTGLWLYEPTEEDDGWTSGGTVVEVNVTDGPFLTASLMAALRERGRDPEHMHHAVVGVERDDHGRITDIGSARGAGRREAWVLLDLGAELDADEREDVESQLRDVLDNALAAVEDYEPMCERAQRAIEDMEQTGTARYDRDEVDEAVELLRWFDDDHWVLLGYRKYELVDVEGGRALTVVKGSGRGILRDESESTYAEPVPLDDIRPELRARIDDGPLLTVSWTNRASDVLRRERMTYLGAKTVDDDGEITGERRFLALLSQRGMSEPPSTVPVLRRKLSEILDREDIVEHSYDERTMRSLFDAIPVYDLFTASVDALHDMLVRLLRRRKSQQVGLLCRPHDHDRGVSALVVLPQHRLSSEIRSRIESRLMERYEAKDIETHLSFTDQGAALLHCVLYTDEGASTDVDVTDLEDEIASLARRWSDQVTTALVEQRDDDARRLAERWAEAFGPGYRDRVEPADAVADITELDGLAEQPEDEPTRARLYPAPDDDGPSWRFTLYRRGQAAELADLLPVLESLGLRAIEEFPHRVSGPDGPVHLHDVGVELTSADDDLDDETRSRVADAAIALLDGRADTDSLNRLVLAAGMRWQDVEVLRAYRRYRRQVETTFSPAYQNDVLVDNPGIARLLSDYFVARFDPDAQRDAHEARDEVVDACSDVTQLDQDRILRGFLGLIDATTRTNRYLQPVRPWLSFKFASADVPNVPLPRPVYEIFVSSPDMEGVHLRGGDVARGGLRWSERLEDYRDEVLGLMKAQVLKNAVIVPTGAKGGFVVQRPSPDFGQVKEQYEVFIRGMLDLTDNIVDDEVRPPDRVVRHDGDDPYLVVAADKGTATFSDLANEVSAEYDFWLDDAFASGGSTGYDHKVMGITARSAWVAVQRHFRELGVDVQTESVTVVGIGDMSGDVFGNAMRRSRAIKLVAAFDHRHVFIDPDPDPEASFDERERLYDMDRSSWDDYDRDVISTGGGVWSRHTKSIDLSDQVRELLGVNDEQLSPPELVRAILRMPTDLLFAGGIGTFVKSRDEYSDDIGDKANESVRVCGNELGARVYGEGANLSITQRGRIEFARNGGRINMDAVDNLGGVDTSDREVNLKILLEDAVDAGAIERDARDDLLADVADDVATRVLADASGLTAAITHESHDITAQPAYESLIRDLAADGKLDREVDVLPSDAELRKRFADGEGLSRPELAVVVGHAKRDVASRLLDSDLLAQECLDDLVRSYFPDPIIERCGGQMAEFRLRGELIATRLAGDIVNRLGSTYVNRTMHELGCVAHEITAAYEAARRATSADELWASVEEYDGEMDPRDLTELTWAVDRLVDAWTRVYVAQHARTGARHAATIDVAALVERDSEAFERLRDHMAQSDHRTEARQERYDRYVELGASEELARELAVLDELSIVPDVAAVAANGDRDVTEVADLFQQIGDELPINNLLVRVEGLKDVHGHWERRQQRGLIDDLRRLRRVAATSALDDYPEASTDEAVARYLDDRAGMRERIDALTADIDTAEQAGLDALAVAVRAMREAFDI
ncbi:MAG: NAD-glutamate dehydrogenase [Actinobacteria bacterium]|nr:NAD-glutamate dehydrogenase [Actinomycetota bacterium]